MYSLNNKIENFYARRIRGAGRSIIGGANIHIFVFCTINFFWNRNLDFKVNCFYSLWTRIYEYWPPQLSIFRRPWEEYLCTQPHIQCLISQLSSSQNERERDVNLTYPPFKLCNCIFTMYLKCISQCKSQIFPLSYSRELQFRYVNEMYLWNFTCHISFHLTV